MRSGYHSCLVEIFDIFHLKMFLKCTIPGLFYLHFRLVKGLLRENIRPIKQCPDDWIRTADL